MSFRKVLLATFVVAMPFSLVVGKKFLSVSSGPPDVKALQRVTNKKLDEVLELRRAKEAESDEERKAVLEAQENAKHDEFIQAKEAVKSAKEQRANRAHEEALDKAEKNALEKARRAAKLLGSYLREFADMQEEEDTDETQEEEVKSGIASQRRALQKWYPEYRSAHQKVIEGKIGMEVLPDTTAEVVAQIAKLEVAKSAALSDKERRANKKQIAKLEAHKETLDVIEEQVRQEEAKAHEIKQQQVEKEKREKDEEAKVAQAKAEVAQAEKERDAVEAKRKEDSKKGSEMLNKAKSVENLLGGDDIDPVVLAFRVKQLRGVLVLPEIAAEDTRLDLSRSNGEDLEAVRATIVDWVISGKFGLRGELKNWHLLKFLAEDIQALYDQAKRVSPSKMSSIPGVHVFSDFEEKLSTCVGIYKPLIENLTKVRNLLNLYKE
jgi:chemotaxis protein histidine kinase CheA